MSRSRILLLTAVVVLAGAGLVAGVLYGTKPSAGNRSAAACAGSAAVAQRTAPFAKGEVAALRMTKTPEPLVDFAFTTPEGGGRLSDLKGRVVLFNLWATWCAPCREEMPALDALQKNFGGKDFEVLALNMDTRNLDRVPRWLTETGITSLALRTDPEGKVFQQLRGAGKVTGLPTTILVDREGCVLGEMAGPAKWDSEDAIKLIRAAVGG